MMARVRRAAPVAVEGIPADLADPDAPVWADRDRFLTYLAEHDYPAGASAEAETSPGRRRQKAAEEWAVSSGIVNPRWPAFPDHHRLRELGVL